ncbi:endolytic transglycosylase MltG [Streptomyces sp. SKN60]|uniref:endolytic transglycosylase MltG n=1 Tax=Streptomyces sp. SKN60 TaxID=2855506 RepID=UPI002247E431|nr:endolytic transglycosylase MltG [Streptomyces sp. SKN60]MCX2184048.1 endolytic transglycosylase MltG [Streptomyces sp. SKN60]
MTEYGRSPGSEPWHPSDPLYGDQGWEGQQQYPQQQYQQQAPYGHQDPYAQQQTYAGGPYEQQQSHDPQQYPQDYGQQYGEQQYGQSAGYDTPGYPAQQYDATWETGQAAMPYNAPPADPYGGQQPDLYGTPEAYPPPQPPGRRRAPQQQPVTDWDAEPEEENHPFFTGEDAPGNESERYDDDAYDDDYDDEPDGRRSGRRGGKNGRGGKGEKGKKAKNGMACLVVAVVLVGGVGGVGYVGYKFWQGRFAEAPDYTGAGSGDVQIEIPRGATGYDIGNILKKNGVVKSVDAFVSAQQKNPKGQSIQAGVYTLKKEMSAESAVSMMLNPASQSNFVIPEGKRNVWVYEQIDKRLELKPGTTQGIAKAKANELGLPDWAKNHKNVKDPLEGFLFPASYPVAKGGKPEDALRKMVSRANQEYAKFDLEAKAKELGVDGPWELVTIASLVQAEGTSHDDFRKMSEVVYNRLKPSNPQTYGGLEFDSTYNYIKNQSTVDLSLTALRKYENPYNTYYVKGLPPGPISNPGIEAMTGTVEPTHDGWYYFISLDGKTSQFTKTNAEHQKLVEKFNESRKN